MPLVPATSGTRAAPDGASAVDLLERAMAELRGAGIGFEILEDRHRPRAA